MRLAVSALGIIAALGCQDIDGKGGSDNTDATVVGAGGSTSGGSAGSDGAGAATGAGGAGVGGAGVGGSGVGGSGVGGSGVGGSGMGGSGVGGSGMGGQGAGGAGAGGQPTGDCDGPIELGASLAEDRLYLRGEPATITITGARGNLAFASEPDGLLFRERDGAVLATAPSGTRDFAWPWWTGAVSVRVTATDGACRADATATFRLAGDVLMADGENGNLQAYGSDGAWLGRAAQERDGRGITAAAVVREAGARAVVYGVGADGDAPAALRTLDADLNPVPGRDFETTDFGGQDLYPRGQAPLHILQADPDGEVLADQLSDGHIARFTPDGAFIDTHRIETPVGTPSARSTGLAVVDGQIIGGHWQRNPIYWVTGPRAGEQFLDFGDAFDGLAELTTGHGGVLVFSWRGSDRRLYLYAPNGREEARINNPNQGARHFIRFLDGYLFVWLNGIGALDADLAWAEGPGVNWDGDADDMIRARGPIVWLD